MSNPNNFSGRKPAIEQIIDVVKLVFTIFIALHVFRFLYRLIPNGTISTLLAFFIFIGMPIIFLMLCFAPGIHGVGTNQWTWSYAQDGCKLPPEYFSEARYEFEDPKVWHRWNNELKADRKFKKELGMHRIWWWPWEDVFESSEKIAVRNGIGFMRE